MGGGGVPNTGLSGISWKFKEDFIKFDFQQIIEWVKLNLKGLIFYVIYLFIQIRKGEIKCDFLKKANIYDFYFIFNIFFVVVVNILLKLL